MSRKKKTNRKRAKRRIPKKQTPSQAEALHQRGVLAFQTGDRASAAALFGQAVAADPTVDNYHFNHAVALRDLGQVDAAMEGFSQTLALNPARADAHYSLGNLYNQRGQAGAALRHYEQAIAIQPEFIDAHYNLGCTAILVGATEQAIGAFRQVLALNPNYTHALINLGNVLRATNQPYDALACYQKALKLHPDEKMYQQLFADTFKQIPIDENTPALTEEIKLGLTFDGVDRQGLAKAGIAVVRRLPQLQPLFDALTPDEGAQLRVAIEDGSIFDALNHPLLHLLLQHVIITDPELERLLTAVRRHLLAQTMARPEAFAGHDQALRFVCALARQCFFTEYVYYQTNTEAEQLEVLCREIGQDFAQNTEPATYRIALAAAYLPLSAVLPRTGEPAAWATRQTDASLARLVGRQVSDPLTELALQKEIQTLTAIDDQVSRAVRDQYEQNPYPRWTDLRYQSPVPLAMTLRRIAPHLEHAGHAVPHAPRILIAGCGTGRQALETARGIARAHVFAIDLSRASLAYALRKAKELGLDNIEFAHADLLELDHLPQHFDVIECTGVLVALDRPLEGWRVLTRLLAPGGYMKIGLYSEIARRHVVAGRRYIAEKGYTPTVDDIRQCRRDIFAMSDDTLISRFRYYRDFFTLSECRDLLFHVKEHRFDLPQVAGCLEELGLEFLGFELDAPRVFETFKTNFPEPDALADLNSWHRFETDHPDTFLQMYQFWVRKP